MIIAIIVKPSTMHSLTPMITMRHFFCYYLGFVFEVRKGITIDHT